MNSRAEGPAPTAEGLSRAESREPRADRWKPKAESRWAAGVGAAVAIFLAGLSVAAAQPWPQWRGPAGDGRVASFSPPAAWPEQLEKQWEITVGSGHASPVLSGSRVIVHARQEDDEIIAAYSVASGKTLWQDRYPAPYTMNPAARGHGPGPKSTPAVADGRAFTLGISGILSAVTLDTGAVLWRTPAATVPPMYGTATSPIVDGSRVIVFMGGHDRGALTAFDAATGTPQWRWDGDAPGYTTPVLATLAGTRQLVTQSQSRVLGIEAATGRLLWEIPFTTNFDQNSVTPLIVDDMVVSSGLENGTTAVRVVREGFGVRDRARVAQRAGLDVHRARRSLLAAASSVSHTGTEASSSRSNPATGTTEWVTRGREADNAALLAADPWLLVGTTNAELIVAQPDSEGLGEVRRYQIADSPVWAHPVVAGNRLLVKDEEKLIAWTLS